MADPALQPIFSYDADDGLCDEPLFTGYDDGVYLDEVVDDEL